MSLSLVLLNGSLPVSNSSAENMLTASGVVRNLWDGSQCS